MPSVDLSFLTRRQWQLLIGIVVLASLYFVFRQEPDPAKVINENLHSWAERLEEIPGIEAGAEPPPAALLGRLGDVRRLVRDAFTEDARIQARGGPQEQGREAIVKWCFALRSHAQKLSITLGEPSTVISKETPDTAFTTVDVTIKATYQGTSYVQNFTCEIGFVRQKKAWRIAELVARPPRNKAGENNTVPAIANQ